MKLKIVIMVLSIVACFFATSAYAAQMSIEPTYQEVRKGDNITVNITVNPEGNEVYCASYTLHFDNTILNATSQTRGLFLRQDGEGSTVWHDAIDNTTGKVEYSECRVSTQVGVGNPGVLATITFQVIGDEGISALDISDYNGELLYSTSGHIPTDTYNGRVGIAQSSTPFVSHGYVSYGNGTPCNNPLLNISNLNTGKEWTAETNETSNYYQLTLASCVDIIAGETLRFNVTSADGNNQWGATEYTVTQTEVDAGSIEYNITLESRIGEVNAEDAVIALQMAVCGEYDSVADVNNDKSVTSLDALMIMQAAVGHITFNK